MMYFLSRYFRTVTAGSFSCREISEKEGKNVEEMSTYTRNDKFMKV